MTDLQADLHEALAKRAAAGKAVTFAKDGRRWELPADGELTASLIANAALMGLAVEFEDAATVAAAKREIAINKAAGDAAAVTGENMETEVIKAMGDRVAEIRKVFPTLSDTGAMARIAESRAPADQELWRAYKGGIALPSSVEKTVKVKKTLKTMNARIDQIMVADPSVRSRESAIAKVAVSRLPGDQELWRDYRIASQQAPDEALPHSEPAPVGKSAESLAFMNLCGALQASYPHMSVAQVRQWAEAIMRKAPPTAMLENTHSGLGGAA
jgi:hypothetical protein